MSLTTAALRQQAILRSLFTPTSLGAAVERLGFVQADPMCAPARAQDLILRHRVHEYRAGDLEREYPTLGLDESLLHLYGFMPALTAQLVHPRTGTWRVELEHPGLADQVLAYVRDHGPADARTVDAHFGSPHTQGNWGSQAKATTKLLEMFHFKGEIRVSRRQGNVRWYEASPPPAPEADPRERLLQLVLLLARLHAPVTVQNLKQMVRWIQRNSPSLETGVSPVEDLVKSGHLRREKVESVTYIWPADEPPTGDVPKVVRLLAPFDPVVWDRDRFEHLWGWPYRLEAYTPAEQRRFGRYALPLLWGDRVIGWANLTHRSGRLEAQFGFVEGRPADPAFGRELEAELCRLELFLQ